MKILATVIPMVLATAVVYSVAAAHAQAETRIPRNDCHQIRYKLAFSVARSQVSENLFERWRRHYCDASTCSMVLCHGMCNDSYERCPTLSDLSAPILSDRSRNCAMSSETLTSSGNNFKSR